MFCIEQSLFFSIIISIFFELSINPAARNTDCSPNRESDNSSGAEPAHLRRPESAQSNRSELACLRRPDSAKSICSEHARLRRSEWEPLSSDSPNSTSPNSGHSPQHVEANSSQYNTYKG